MRRIPARASDPLSNAAKSTARRAEALRLKKVSRYCRDWAGSRSYISGWRIGYWGRSRAGPVRIRIYADYRKRYRTRRVGRNDPGVRQPGARAAQQGAAFSSWVLLIRFVGSSA